MNENKETSFLFESNNDSGTLMTALAFAGDSLSASEETADVKEPSESIADMVKSARFTFAPTNPMFGFEILTSDPMGSSVMVCFAIFSNP